MPTDADLTPEMTLRPGLHEDLTVVADIFIASRLGAVPAMPPMVGPVERAREWIQGWDLARQEVPAPGANRPRSSTIRRVHSIAFARGAGRPDWPTGHATETRMTDEISRDVPPMLIDEGFAAFHAATSRREFLRVIGLGATIALFPGFAACGSDSVTGPSNGMSLH